MVLHLNFFAFERKKSAINSGFFGVHLFYCTNMVTRTGIEPEKLKTYVKNHPDATQQEMADEFGCCNQAISKALKRNKITRKKRQPTTKNRIRKR